MFASIPELTCLFHTGRWSLSDKVNSGSLKWIKLHWYELYFPNLYTAIFAFCHLKPFWTLYYRMCFECKTQREADVKKSPLQDRWDLVHRDPKHQAKVLQKWTQRRQNMVQNKTELKWQNGSYKTASWREKLAEGNTLLTCTQWVKSNDSVDSNQGGGISTWGRAVGWKDCKPRRRDELEHYWYV